MPNETQNLPAVNYYTPVELVGIYRNFLQRRGENNVIWLRGIYIQKPQQGNWSAYFDDLRDVNSQITVTLKVDKNFERPQSNSLVQVAGIVETNTFTNGTIQIMFCVTRFNIVKDQFFSEAELKRIELKQKKSATLSKNVNLEIGQVLFEGRRPRIALIIAANTRTQGDFEDGLRNARAAIDFEEFRVAFTHTTELCNTIRTLDGRGYTAIAIYRGGGIDSNTDVDKPEVLEAVVNMKTPFISGVGHKPEPIFLRQVADAWTATPQGLGQYFSEIVEDIAAKRNNSRAALVKEVEGQFKKQLEDSNKKNKDLLEQVEKMTKQAKEQTEQLGKLQEQVKKQNEQNVNQSKEFHESLTKMQNANGELNKAIQRLTAQNTQTAKDLNDAKEIQRQLERQLEEALNKNKGCMSGCLGMVAAIVTLISFASWIICIII